MTGVSSYSAAVLDHLAHPRNRGKIDAANGVGRGENPVCGDAMTVWVRVEAGTVVSIGFEARGCEPTIAAGSVATELVKGKPVAEALALSRHEVETALGGLPRIKMHCAQLAAQVIHRALAEHATRMP